MYVQLTTNFQLLPRLGVWDSQKREKELVLFPTNLTFFWDREILCASTQVGHLQVQLPLAGLCWLCCAWVSFPLFFFFFSQNSFSMFFLSISNERSTSLSLGIDLILLICLFKVERINFFFFWLYMFFVCFLF